MFVNGIELLTLGLTTLFAAGVTQTAESRSCHVGPASCKFGLEEEVKCRK